MVFRWGPKPWGYQFRFTLRGNLYNSSCGGLSTLDSRSTSAQKVSFGPGVSAGVTGVIGGSLGYPILAFDLSTAFWPTLICILQLLPLFAGQLGSARTWAAGQARQAGQAGQAGLRLTQSGPSGFQLCSLLSHLIYGLPSTRHCQLNEIKPCNEQKLCATCNFH